MSKEKSIEFLKKAIKFDIEDAKTDDDFDKIRGLKEFKELIGD